MLSTVPYWARALTAATLLLAFAGVDLFVHGARATRWREYLFWMFCGASGAAFAILNDLVTSRLSKDYFVIGKGLPDDPAGFVAAVVAFAARVGFAAGLVIGGALLVANNPTGALRQLRYRALASYLLLPLAAALMAAPLVAAIGSWDVQGLGAELRRGLSEGEVAAFLQVQRIHVGLYAGGLLGTAAAVIAVRRRRRDASA